MVWNGIYAFDEADATLSLLPMAARRALDVAGLHLSLATWQTLPLSARQQLVELGAAHSVLAEAVVSCLAQLGAAVRTEPPRLDPPADALPDELADMLTSTCSGVARVWPRLRSLDRFVLAQLARRGKRERLAAAYHEIAAVSGD
jgi:hypothetical protein